ncbi:unnamed protein product [Aureobasidium vineae]|uniref:Uncharacterized protein n=1 Tax=Aureobasidium vineae TaxID=2773715 RepID=A0A9N8JHV0_9PEZI|nr:unnamed protein product [Aureobasidium vineae]
MKATTLFGISTAITGALATTGYPSVTSSVVYSANCTGTPEIEVPDDFNITKEEVNSVLHAGDKLYVSLGDTEHCVNATFDTELRLFYDACYPVDQDDFKSLRSRFAMNFASRSAEERCVLAAFENNACSEDGTIIADLEETDDAQCAFEHGLENGPFGSFKFVCGVKIDDDWSDLSDNEHDIISARAVDTDAVRDHVRVFPADGANCNNALDRDSDRQVYNDCHTFAKPFFSIRAQITRGKGKSKLDGSQPCSVLVFSDEKCHKNGAEVIHLDNTHELGVCHSVSLHHKDDNTAIAGHSWKWVCGQDIAGCLRDTQSTTSVKAIKSTVKTVTATSTASLACSLTTEAAHSTSVIASVVTMKPVTHTITSVFTKTQLRVHTKLLTSVATDVSTMRHTVTKPFSTTYKVCDAVATSRS